MIEQNTLTQVIWCWHWRWFYFTVSAMYGTYNILVVYIFSIPFFLLQIWLIVSQKQARTQLKYRRTRLKDLQWRQHKF